MSPTYQKCDFGSDLLQFLINSIPRYPLAVWEKVFPEQVKT